MILILSFLLLSISHLAVREVDPLPMSALVVEAEDLGAALGARPVDRLIKAAIQSLSGEHASVFLSEVSELIKLHFEWCVNQHLLVELMIDASSLGLESVAWFHNIYITNTTILPFHLRVLDANAAVGALSDCRLVHGRVSP